MTHAGDGDTPDDGRRKRRRRRRGRRGKHKAAGASGVQRGDTSGAANDTADAPGANDLAAAAHGAAGSPSASGKRRSRSRRRKSGVRANGAPGTSSSGSVQPDEAPSGEVQSGSLPSGATEPEATQSRAGQSRTGQSRTGQSRTGKSRNGQSRNAKGKRGAKARQSGPSRHGDARRGTDVPAIAAETTSPVIETSSEVASARSSDADALAARRARADRETSAGGIVYRVQNGEALFLIIRDSYRNWGFPKGHLEGEELPDEAAVREVQEETGLVELHLDGAIETIDWFFRFRGRLVHKVCHFYLMRTESTRTVPQREEGITACRWARFDEATRLISYANARSVLSRANAMVLAGAAARAVVDSRAIGNERANVHINHDTNSNGDADANARANANVNANVNAKENTNDSPNDSPNGNTNTPISANAHANTHAHSNTTAADAARG